MVNYVSIPTLASSLAFETVVRMKNSSPTSVESESSRQAGLDLGWSAGKRTIATVAILFYLLVVVIAPLSNPVASASFTAPIARLLSPLHRVLFLGHGYRFFGPDPGPSHIVFYTVTRADGEQIEGHFPDAHNNWPRLLYHRWFMLSETIFEEHRFTPDKVGFEQAQAALTVEIAAMRAAGKFDVVNRLENLRLDQERRYKNARTRIDDLVNSLATYLADEYEGVDVKLFVRERLIAGPLDVAGGIKLDDERYLTPPIPIGPGREELPAADSPTEKPDP